MPRARKTQDAPTGGTLATSTSAGVVRIGGRSYTIGSAITRGLITEDLTLTKSGLNLHYGAQANPQVDGSTVRSGAVDADDPVGDLFNADGTPKRRKRQVVLRPRNVDATGEPITDEETLARIAAETLAKEEADRAARDAAGA